LRCVCKNINGPEILSDPEMVELLQKGHGGWEGFMSVVSWYLMHLPSFEFRVFLSSSGDLFLTLSLIGF
jgi:hypothetical protein